MTSRNTQVVKQYVKYIVLILYLYKYWWHLEVCRHMSDCAFPHHEFLHFLNFSQWTWVIVIVSGKDNKSYPYDYIVAISGVSMPLEISLPIPPRHVSGETLTGSHREDGSVFLWPGLALPGHCPLQGQSLGITWALGLERPHSQLGLPELLLIIEDLFHISLFSFFLFHLFLFFRFIFNWTMLALQYWCDHCHISTWISPRCTQVPSLL